MIELSLRCRVEIRQFETIVIEKLYVSRMACSRTEIINIVLTVSDSGAHEGIQTIIQS